MPDESAQAGSAIRGDGTVLPHPIGDMATFAGTIDCAMQCPVPEGVALRELPRPRHNWGDMVHCPNDECGRSFLVVSEGVSLPTGEPT